MGLRRHVSMKADHFASKSPRLRPITSLLAPQKMLRLAALLLLVATSSAAPLSPTKAATDGTSTTPLAKSIMSAASSPPEKKLKQTLLQRLHDGTMKLKSLFSSAAALASESSLPVVGKVGSLSKEYEAMAHWWCEENGRQQASKAASAQVGYASSLCARRTLAKQLTGLSSVEKKKKLDQQTPKTAAERKRETDEAKQMVEHFCRTGAGTTMQICVRSSAYAPCAPQNN